MKYILLLFPLIYLSATSLANATNYYYCDCQAGTASNQCIAGDDANSGTSPSSPRRTVSNANSTFRGFSAGDSINFCRGGSFISNANATWTSPNCTADNRCSVTAYDLPGQQNPQLARPIITQTTSNSLFSVHGNSGHTEGYSFSDLDLRCTNCSSGAANGFYIYDDADDITITNVSIDSFRIGLHLGSSNPAIVGVRDGSTDNIVLKNISVTNNHSQGLLGGANDLVIEDSYFENNGSGTDRDHNIYISRGNNLVIRGNDIYRSSMSSDGKCFGAPIVIHAKEPPLDTGLIEGNTVREDIGKANGSCWGIAVDPGNTSDEVFLNYTIRGNKVINVGNTGIGVTSCQNCVIENNIIVHQQEAYKIRAIDAPSKNRASNDGPMDAITIRNNSIYISSNVTGSIGIKLKGEGSNHSIVSNTIHYSGTGTFYCLDADLPATAYQEIDNNVCYFPNASGASKWNLYLSGSSDPLATWQATGRGSNSKIADPEYTSPGVPEVDLSPASITSGVIAAGHSTMSSTKDLRGKTRDGQPDAGAFEYGTFNPPAKTKLYLQ